MYLSQQSITAIIYTGFSSLLIRILVFNFGEMHCTWTMLMNYNKPGFVLVEVFAEASSRACRSPARRLLEALTTFPASKYKLELRPVVGIQIEARERRDLSTTPLNWRRESAPGGRGRRGEGGTKLRRNFKRIFPPSIPRSPSRRFKSTQFCIWNQRNWLLF